MPTKCLEKSERKPVFISRASYFNPVSRRWQTGIFKLHHSYFEFMTEGGDRNSKAPFHLSLPLATISSIEKRQSSFVFASLVIIVGSETHWFASFANRDTVYNLMELFWRDLLLVKQFSIRSSNASTLNSPSATSLGKELLSILYESEKTLSDAAGALQDQGRQLHDAEETVHDINKDLTVAEKLLSKMSLCPTASISNVINASGTEEKKKVIIRRKYKVTFSNESNSNSYNDWEKGTLVISDEFALIDEKGNIKFHFPFHELRAIQIVSPWEFSLSQESDCEGILYNIMCPALSRVLKVLATIPSLQNKVFYGNEDSDTNMHSSSSCSSSLSLGSPVSTPSLTGVGWLTPDFPQDQLQQVQSCKSLTDEELKEISSVLSNLQSLATEVGKEQQWQMEKIGTLITDVDKTELRANVDTKLIRRLT